MLFGHVNDTVHVRRGQRRTEELRRDLAFNTSTSEGLKQASAWNRTDEGFIGLMFTSFGPELDILKKADATTIEACRKGMIGSYGSDATQLPSHLLYGNGFFPEVDRTLTSMLAVKWLVTDDYEAFTSGQAQHVQLSKAQFTELRALTTDVCKTPTDCYMLMLSVIINDLGKYTGLGGNNGNKKLNHDQLLHQVASRGRIDVLEELRKQDKRCLMKGLALGGRLNISQLAQGESVPGSLQAVRGIMNGDMEALRLKICEVYLDVAGTSASSDPRGAKTWTSPVHECYRAAQKCIESVVQGDSPQDAYDRMLMDCAERLREAGWSRRLNPSTSSEDRALARILLLSRASTKEVASRIEKAVDALSTSPVQGRQLKDLEGRPIGNVWESLCKVLSVRGTGDGTAIIPYYAPAVTAKVAEVTRKHSESRKQQAMTEWLIFLCRSIALKPETAHRHQVIEFNMSIVVDYITDGKFLNDPRYLNDVIRPPLDVTYNWIWQPETSRRVMLAFKRCLSLLAS